MGSEPLPSTLAPFDWSGWPLDTAYRHQSLTMALLNEQTACLARHGIVPRVVYPLDATSIKPGGLWAPAVDLALGGSSTFVRHISEPRSYTPYRDVEAVAAGRRGGRLLRGTVLRLEAILLNYHWEGMATIVWGVDDARLGVPFLYSELVASMSYTALLADHLIVPIGHPILGDDNLADRVVRDLQDVTRAFREANDLPADGWPALASDAPQWPGLTNRP